MLIVHAIEYNLTHLCWAYFELSKNASIEEKLSDSGCTHLRDLCMFVLSLLSHPPKPPLGASRAVVGAPAHASKPKNLNQRHSKSNPTTYRQPNSFKSKPRAFKV